MKVYIGQARGASLIKRLTDFGFGEMTVRAEYPPRRRPWAFDNGAFSDWKAGVPFNAAKFMLAVDEIHAAKDRPDFLVVPDIVAGGKASLEFSSMWIKRLLGIAPLFIAIQDGMEEADVERILEHPVAGLFVGGTLPWKIRSGARWVAFGHAHGLPVHIGRVGTMTRTRWAKRIGADSIDSCLPLWSEGNLQRFLSGLAKQAQLEMAL